MVLRLLPSSHPVSRDLLEDSMCRHVETTVADSNPPLLLPQEFMAHRPTAAYLPHRTQQTAEPAILTEPPTEAAYKADRNAVLSDIPIPLRIIIKLDFNLILYTSPISRPNLLSHTSEPLRPPFHPKDPIGKYRPFNGYLIKSVKTAE